MNNKVEEIDRLSTETKASIFCVTEHHLNDEQAKLIKLQGYNLGSIFCREARSKEGTSIFIKENIKFRPLDNTKFSVEGEIEITAVELEHLNVNVMTVYRMVQKFADKRQPLMGEG